MFFPAPLRPLLTLASILHAAQAAPATSFFPGTTGTTWEYIQTGAQPARLTVRIAGPETFKGEQMLKIETTAGDEIVQTDVLDPSDRGLLLYQRRLPESEPATFAPPRLLVPMPLKVGSEWEVDDEVDRAVMHQKFKAVAQEDVVVPAGTYHAYRLHCEQPWPLQIEIDRWFAEGTGVVRETITTRGPGGRLLARTTKVLNKFTLALPGQEPPPSAVISSAAKPEPKVHVVVSKERDGDEVTTFQTDAPNIYVRWQGKNLPVGENVRAKWVVEDVGDVAAPNFVVDQTDTEVTRPDFAARFTLSRPKDGWATGKYRVEVYLEDKLLEKVAVSVKE